MVRTSITTRLGLGFLLTLGSLLAISALALLSFTHVFNAIQLVQQHHLREMSVFEDIRVLISGAVAEDHAFILSGGEDVYDQAFEADIDEVRRLFSKHASLHESVAITPPEVEKIRSLKVATERLSDAHDLVQELLVAGRLRDARRVSDTEGLRAAASALALVGSLVEEERREADEVVAAAREDAARAHRVILVVAGLATVLVGGVALSVTRSVTGPVQRLLDVTRRVDRGNLGVRANLASRDEIGEVAQSVDRMIARLDAAFAEQERFFADVSHELRTPITIVRGHLDVLRRGAFSAERVEHAVAVSVEELDRMGRLVNDLLTLARATRTDFLSPGLVHLREFLPEVLHKAEAMAPRQWRLGPVADVAVSADRDRLTQALLNLLRNATEHTGPQQTIELRATANADRTEIAVADEGKGIPAELLPHVFERFRHGEGGSRTGLGLSIVRAIVQAHGGEVRAASRPGAGSTFTVVLPVERGAPAGLPVAATDPRD